MKKISIILFLVVIVLNFSCQKEQGKTIPTTNVESVSVLSLDDLLSTDKDTVQLKFSIEFKNDSSLLTFAPCDSSLKSKKSLTPLTIKGGTTWAFERVARYFGQWNYSISIYARQFSTYGACGAYDYTILPQDLYSYVSYSSCKNNTSNAIRKRNCVSGDPVQTYYCANRAGKTKYDKKVIVKSCDFVISDIDGYSYGGFIIDNKGTSWYSVSDKTCDYIINAYRVSPLTAK